MASISLTAKENKQHDFQGYQILVVEGLFLAFDQLLGFRTHFVGWWLCGSLE